MSRFIFKNKKATYYTLSVFNYTSNHGKRRSNYINNHKDFEQLKKYWKELQNEHKAFEKLKNNFDELSDKNFVQLFEKFYRFEFDNLAKLVKLSSDEIKNPTIFTISTNDIGSSTETEGHGRDFSWWTEYRRLDYHIIADASVINKKQYTLKELSEITKKYPVIYLGYTPKERLYDENVDKNIKSNSRIKLDFLDFFAEELALNSYYRDDSLPREKVFIDNLEEFIVDPTLAYKNIRQYVNKFKLYEDYEEYNTQWLLEIEELTDAFKQLLAKEIKKQNDCESNIKSISSLIDEITID